MPNVAPQYRPTVKRTVRDDRLSPHRRGYGGKRWQALRKAVYVRDQGACRACGRVVGKPKEAHVDHIKPKAAGGQDDMANLQLLCAGCHSRKTAAERARQHPNSTLTQGGRGVRKLGVLR